MNKYHCGILLYVIDWEGWKDEVLNDIILNHGYITNLPVFWKNFRCAITYKYKVLQRICYRNFVSIYTH